MKKFFTFALLVSIISLVEASRALGQNNEFSYIEPRSNMLGLSVTSPVKNLGFLKFGVNPINSLSKDEIVDTIMQIGPDTASIVSKLRKDLNLTFFKKTGEYELKLYPSKIKIAYLGPKTMSSSKLQNNNVVYGIIYSTSVKIELEQTLNQKVDYNKAFDIAKNAIKGSLPTVDLVLEKIKIDSVTSKSTRHVVSSWSAKNSNLVYGVATANIKNANRGLEKYKRAFNGEDAYDLALVSDECSDSASPIYETGFFNKNNDGTPYKLCYKIYKGKPELAVYEANNTTTPKIIIPRAVGLNGPENVWSGNYLISSEPRRKGKATQMVYLAVNARLKNSADLNTVTVTERKDGYLSTAIYYPEYILLNK